MSEILIQRPGSFKESNAPARGTRKTETPATARDQAEAPPPVGYRRVSRRWRVLPDGTRDYAVFHGKTVFTSLLPVSSRVRTPKR